MGEALNCAFFSACVSPSSAVLAFVVTCVIVCTILIAVLNSYAVLLL